MINLFLNWKQILRNETPCNTLLKDVGDIP